MKRFAYRQNNSFGVHDYFPGIVIGAYVVVEADSEDAANERASTITSYRGGRGDCPCCGERWSLWAEEVAEDFAPERYSFCRDMEFAGFLHAAGGTITPIAWEVSHD